MSLVLPDSWSEAELSDIAYIKNGYAFKSSDYQKNGSFLMRIGNVQDGHIVLDDPKYIDSQHSKHDEYSLRLDDVLISLTGNIGRVGIVKESHIPSVLNQRVGKIELLDKNLFRLDLLFYFLHSPSFKRAISQGGHGAAQQNISTKDIEKMSVVIPPLNEQAKIVSKIEELFSDIDAGTDSLKRVEANLKRYRASVLKAACEGKLVPTEAQIAKNEEREYEHASVLLERILKERKEKWEKENPGKKYKEPTTPDTSELPELPEGWVWATFLQLSHKIGDVDHKMPKAVSKGVPYISTKDFFGEKEIDFENAKNISEEDYKHLCRKIFPSKGDILLSRYGTVGQVRIVDTNSKIQASYSIAIIKTVSNKNLTNFIALALQSDFLQKQIKRDTRSTAQPDLGLAHIREFVFPVPPEAEQVRILQEMETVTSKVDKISTGLEISDKKGPALKQAILKKAFQGDLVPQDPNDEPASKLLERIKAARTEQEVKTKPKKRTVRKSKKKSS